jgi:hypothetical protein
MVAPRGGAGKINDMNTFGFKCHECLIVFDVAAAPPAEWIEPMPDDTESGPPTCLDRCPFCGSGDVEMTHDLPAIAN